MSFKDNLNSLLVPLSLLVGVSLCLSVFLNDGEKVNVSTLEEQRKEVEDSCRAIEDSLRMVISNQDSVIVLQESLKKEDNKIIDSLYNVKQKVIIRNERIHSHIDTVNNNDLLELIRRF